MAAVGVDPGLLAQADELVQRMNADVFSEMAEEHRLQFEIHAQKPEKIKSEVQGGIDKRKASKTGSSVEGFHEAIVDISEAMQGLKKFFS